MAVGTEVVARRYEDVEAGVPISVDFPLYEATDVYVYFGLASVEAVRNTDYTVTLGDDFDTFTLTPTASLIVKINDLIVLDPNETNYIVVRRELDYLTDTTPAAVRYTPFTSREFERTILRFQQIEEKLNRAVVLTPNFVGDNPLMQLGEIEPNATLVFDALAQRIIAGPAIGEIGNAAQYAQEAKDARDAANLLLEGVKAVYLGEYDSDEDATAAAVEGTPIDGQLYYNGTDKVLKVYDTPGGWRVAGQVEFQVSATHIQWRVVGTTTWLDLLALAAIKGDKGDQGEPGERDTRNFCWAGSFDWWRARGNSVASTAGRVLTADGWTIGRSSGALGCTVSKQQGSRGNNACARVQRNSGDTQTNTVAFVFNLGLADTRPLVGQPFVATMRVRGGANFSGASLGIAVKSGSSAVEQAVTLTNGNYTTGDNAIASVPALLTTAWQDIEISGTVPPTATQIMIRLSYTPTGTAGAADYFEIEEVQIQKGTVASEFVAVDPTYALMKSLPQLWKTYNDDVAPGTLSYNGALRVNSDGTDIAKAVVFSPQWPKMRTNSPTVTAYSPQTGASGKIAKGSTADIDATASHIGGQGCGIANAVVTTNNDLHYVHVVVEDRL